MCGISNFKGLLILVWGNFKTMEIVSFVSRQLVVHCCQKTEVHKQEYRLPVSLLMKLVSNWLQCSCLSPFDVKHVDNFI